ncbi:MAG: hypothetical protein HQM13_15745 [SAR324 cluster bacterium]|nr:hypothetical protein [SAR324 cluster bacterium]
MEILLRIVRHGRESQISTMPAKFWQSWFLLILVFFFETAWAFDRDIELNFPNFNNENFLDIKSYQLRPELAEIWHETSNGLRIASGSLDLDYLYLATEIRILQTVTEQISASYRLKGEEFYAIKPVRQQVGVKYQFLENYSASLIGFPAYDKRVGEVGAAFEVGEFPWHYLRISHLEQAPYYNEKNFEEDRFLKEPVENGIEGAYRFLEKWQLRFQLTSDQSMEQFFPDEQLIFKYEGEDAGFVLEYKPADDNRWGLNYRGFDYQKSRLADNSLVSGENKSQTLQFLSMDLYWIFPILGSHSLTLGTQFDRFRNLFRDLNDQEESYNYLFQTWQVYGTWLHPGGNWWNYDYGFYLGDTLEEKDNLSQLNPDKKKQSLEAKLRVSLELYNLVNQGHFFFTTTWNVDNFFSDFWDGGHAAYQTRF